MPEPVPIEKFRKDRKGRTYQGWLARRLKNAHPDDWILEAMCQDIEGLTEHFPVITHAHVQKLRRALREQPETVLAFMREEIVPFIDSLPEIDWSIVGAEVPESGGDICLNCLTRHESARLDGGDFYLRDDADEYELVCTRCGEPL